MSMFRPTPHLHHTAREWPCIYSCAVFILQIIDIVLYICPSFLFLDLLHFFVAWVLILPLQDGDQEQRLQLSLPARLVAIFGTFCWRRYGLSDFRWLGQVIPKLPCVFSCIIKPLSFVVHHTEPMHPITFSYPWLYGPIFALKSPIIRLTFLFPKLLMIIIM